MLSEYLIPNLVATLDRHYGPSRWTAPCWRVCGHSIQAQQTEVIAFSILIVWCKTLSYSLKIPNDLHDKMQDKRENSCKDCLENAGILEKGADSMQYTASKFFFGEYVVALAFGNPWFKSHLSQPFIKMYHRHQDTGPAPKGYFTACLFP